MEREPFDPNRIKKPQDNLAAGDLFNKDKPKSKKSSKSSTTPLSVSQITAKIKFAIESELPATLHIVGEISNFKKHSSGHLYLTLKDEACEISCVMWRSAAQKLKFNPSDGMEVVATGHVEVFERAGRYQLYIRKIEPRGVGALELAFRQLCEKLHKEGLFDEDHKKALPEYPQRIVIVTSPTGAAIADMLRTIERRYPCVEILIYPVAVQGEAAALQIAAAIQKINTLQNQLGPIDLMIVGRGGGSLEDLWSFNEEVVARAIYASHIPIISAVGHEVDVTVADLVADVRAVTPTAAAELAVPVLDEVFEELSSQQSRLQQSLKSLLELANAKLTTITTRRTFSEPLSIVQQREQIIDEMSNRVTRKLSDRVALHRRRLDQLEPTLQRISPHTYLIQQSNRLRHLEQRLERSSPAHTILTASEKLKRLSHTIHASIHHKLRLGGEQIQSLRAQLQAVSHESVLQRGFSVTRTKKGRKLLRSIDAVRDGQRLITQIADGKFESQVINQNQMELFSE